MRSMMGPRAWATRSPTRQILPLRLGDTPLQDGPCRRRGLGEHGAEQFSPELARHLCGHIEIERRLAFDVLRQPELLQQHDLAYDTRFSAQLFLELVGVILLGLLYLLVKRRIPLAADGVVRNAGADGLM